MKSNLPAALAAFFLLISKGASASEYVVVEFPSILRDYEVITLRNASGSDVQPILEFTCGRSIGGPQSFHIFFPERGKVIAVRCPLAEENSCLPPPQRLPRDPRPVPDLRVEACIPWHFGWTPTAHTVHELYWPVTWDVTYTTGKPVITKEAAAH
jgi:hypothetical protein